MTPPARLQIADCRLQILKSEINLKSEISNLQFQDRRW